MTVILLKFLLLSATLAVDFIIDYWWIKQELEDARTRQEQPTQRRRHTPPSGDLR